MARKLTRQDAGKWLEAAAYKDAARRPALSFAHRQQVGGRPAVVSSDGYRIHVVYDHPGEDEWLAFKTSAEQPPAEYVNIDPYMRDKNAVPLTALGPERFAELVRACKVANVFRADKGVLTPVTLQFEPGALTVSVKGERGSAQTVIEVDRTCPPRVLRFDLAYLLEALRGFSGGVQVECNDVSIHIYDDSREALLMGLTSRSTP